MLSAISTPGAVHVCKSHMQDQVHTQVDDECARNNWDILPRAMCVNLEACNMARPYGCSPS
jgi:hypothetical protein